MLFILLAALLLFGGDKLPEVARGLSKEFPEELVNHLLERASQRRCIGVEKQKS